jgi:pSer/pThr/pTyr-binding forkhead associated (FHA) protein
MPLTVFVPVTDGRSRGETGRFVTVSGDRIVLGRGASADVRLPDASVATRHASVRADGGRWLLQDERSRNGTALRSADGAVVRLDAGVPQRVEDGAWVRLGRVWVRLFVQPPTGLAGECRTAKDLATSLVSLGLEALGRPNVAEVHFVDGPSPIDFGGETPSARNALLLEDGAEYVFGRGDRSVVVLDDPEVSRVQCTVTRRGALVHVKALGGVTLLGERELPLGENALWNPKDLLQIGRSLFGLVDPVAGTLAAMEADAEVGVPAELLPPCPVDDPSVVTPPLPPVEHTADAPLPTPTPPPPAPLPAPARRARAPRALLSRAEFTVVLLAIFVLLASLIALSFVLKK